MRKRFLSFLLILTMIFLYIPAGMTSGDVLEEVVNQEETINEAEALPDANEQTDAPQEMIPESVPAPSDTSEEEPASVQEVVNETTAVETTEVVETAEEETVTPDVTTPQENPTTEIEPSDTNEASDGETIPAEVTPTEETVAPVADAPDTEESVPTADTPVTEDSTPAVDTPAAGVVVPDEVPAVEESVPTAVTPVTEDSTPAVDTSAAGVVVPDEVPAEEPVESNIEADEEDEDQEEIQIFEIDEDTLVKYNGEEEIVTVPDGIRIIDSKAFANNKFIKKVILPDSVEIIGNFAFEECSNLEEVKISEKSKLGIIGKGAFKNDTKLDVSFAENVKSIVESAFEGIELVKETTEETQPLNEDTKEETSEIEDAVENEPIEQETDIIDENLEESDFVIVVQRIDESSTEISIPVAYSGDTTQLEITVDPIEAEKEANETATFTATVANATGEVSYQWEYSRDEKATWAKTGLPGNKTSTLEVAAIDGRLTMWYRCVATVDGQTVTSEAVHFVRPAVVAQLEITVDPVEAEKEANETATFTATVENATGEISYQWEYSRDEKATWAKTGLPGNKTATLEVAAIDGRLTMWYRCVAIADGQTVISDPVHFVRPSEFTEEYEGYTLTYSILEDGNVSVNAFSGTAKAITIPENPRDGYTVTEIGEEAFMDKDIESIVLPNTITAIRARAFKNCTSLSSMSTH